MPDQSFGRRHDGAYTWAVFHQNPSPNASNSGYLSNPEWTDKPDAFAVFPSPYTSQVTLRNSAVTVTRVTVLNALGQVLTKLDLPALSEVTWTDPYPSGLRIFTRGTEVVRALKR
jgi:hypothetical protein